MSNPIADLTYRGYDGKLDAPQWRWWVIAKMGIKTNIQKRAFWGWSIASAYWYLVLGAVFYFMDTLGTQLPNANGGNPLLSQVNWRDQFLNAFSIQQLLVFILALFVGIGSIANDNRANALLVYLSKPCTKLDYLMGKWMTIFLLLCAVVGIPMLGFYAYCALSYQQYGFGHYPGLLWKLMAVIPLTAGFHASLCLGLSSLFNQGRLAGATYAGIYFISLSFTKMIQVVHFISQASQRRHREGPPIDIVNLATQFFYCSVDGLQIGLAKAILGTDGSPLFPAPNAPPSIAAPNGWIMGAAYLVICWVSMLVAYSRIHAVEVVKG